MGAQGSSTLKPRTTDELKRTTSFSQHQLEHWYDHFRTTYPNKALTREDFKKIYGQQFPFGDATAFTNHVFKQLDVNDDGKVDFREFMVWMNFAAVGDDAAGTDDKLRRVFAVYDLNANGFIGRDEMGEVVGAIFKMNGMQCDGTLTSKLVDDVFARLDSDRDDQLSEEEFLGGVKENVDIMRVLQCDWESKMARSLERSVSGSGSSTCCLHSS